MHVAKPIDPAELIMMLASLAIGFGAPGAGDRP
jgi:hypothetical protein